MLPHRYDDRAPRTGQPLALRLDYREDMTTPADRPQDRVTNPLPPSADDQARSEMPVIRVPSQQDLTVPTPPPPLPVPAASSGVAPKPAVGLFSDVKRTGRWRVEPVSKFVHVFGDAVIDLREAEFASPSVEIQVVGAFGDTKLIVTPGTDIVVQGITVFGDQKINRPADAPPNGLRVVLTANGAFGDVKVYTLEVGEQIPRWWRRRPR